MKKVFFNAFLVPFQGHTVCFYSNPLKDGGFTVNEIHYTHSGRYAGSATTLVRPNGQREIISFIERPTE